MGRDITTRPPGVASGAGDIIKLLYALGWRPLCCVLSYNCTVYLRHVYLTTLRPIWQIRYVADFPYQAWPLGEEPDIRAAERETIGVGLRRHICSSENYRGYSALPQ